MIKAIWQHSVRTYLKLGMFFYFKSIRVFGLENIPTNKPVLLLCNHQNALLDPLLLVIKLKQFAYYLARAGVFKKDSVSKLLATFNMLPVYRVRDGWNNLTNNNAIFEQCKTLLHDNKTLVIYPEGSHNLARRVRPLSKGFTRIVFDTLETYPELDLQLIPIGMNYKNALVFADSTTVYIDKPIAAKNYVSENQNEAVVNLKQDVHKALTKITTHIPEDNYDESLETLKQLNVDFLNPISVNQCIANNFKDCEQTKPESLSIFKRLFKFLLIIAVIVPYVIWKLVAEPKVKEVEFLSTFRFAIAVGLVPIYLLVMLLVLSLVFSFKIAILYVLGTLFLALLAVKL